METSQLAKLLLIWLGAVAAIAVFRVKRNIPGSGLTMAFLINLWLIHWLASAIYLLPGYQNHELQVVEAGLLQSVYAIVAFAVGSVAIAPALMKAGVFPRVMGFHDPDPYLPKAYVWTGIVFYLLLSSALGRLPTATALISTGQELIVVGISLCCWRAWKEKDPKRMAAWIGISLLLPVVTVVTRGFIGYGAVATFSVLVFASNFVRSKVVILIVGVALGYIGLSVYVSYMRDRGEIRDSVWGGQSLEDRLARVGKTAGTFEWFDPSNMDHLDRIDDRLNQNYLVGAAVNRLSLMGGYARGETLWEALTALVPRILWPDKPYTAGSGNLVTQFTGIQYAAGTSVGIGQVMECYVNFGTLGVIVGFLFFGIIVTALDLQAAERLAYGDLHGFVLYYLPGLAFLQVGGQLAEVTSSAGASVVIALIANKILDRFQKQRTERPSKLASEAISAVHAKVRR